MRLDIALPFVMLAPIFINSTIVLGDSNTTNLKFGSGLGTLGQGCKSMFNFGGCILINLSLFGNFRTLGVYVVLSQKVKTDVFKWKVRFAGYRN